MNVKIFAAQLAEHLNAGGSINLPTMTHGSAMEQLAQLATQSTGPLGAVRTGTCEILHSAVEILEFIQQDEGTMAALEQIADALANKTMEPVKALDMIHRQVTTLTPKVTAVYESNLAADPVASVHMNKQQTNESLPDMEWDNTNYVAGITGVVRMVNDSANIPSLGTQMAYLGIYMARQYAELKKKPFAQVNLEPKMEAKIITAMQASDKTITEAEAKAALARATTPDLAMMAISAVRREPVPSLMVMEQVTGYVEDLKVCKALRTLGKLTLDLSDKTTEDLKHNVGVLMDFATAAAYCVIHHRQNTYADKLLLSNGRINPDNVDAFKAAGGTGLDVLHYKNYMNKMVPYAGVSVTDLQMAVPKIRANIKAMTDQVESKLNTAKTTARINALTHVLSMDMAERVKAEKRMITVDETNRVTAIVQQGVTLKKPTEDIIYRYAMMGRTNTPEVMALHTELSAHYAKAASEGVAITPDDVQKIDRSVLLDKVCVFVRDQLMA